MRIGIIGTGRIANRFIPESNFIEDINVCGVYNPHIESAKKFAEKWNISFYDELHNLYEQIEAIYVASPHETHYQYVKDALEHGKHVLVEKPFAFSEHKERELYQYAKERKLVLLEGIKTAYCPGFLEVLKQATSGKIGEIKSIEACFTKLVNPRGRELMNITFGGSFTELGSYCMLPILKIFGTQYQSIRFDTIKAENGLDIFTKAHLVWTNGLATATCGLGVKSEGNLIVSGTKGYIVVKAPWWKTSDFEIHYEDPSTVERYSITYEGDGLRYEIKYFQSMIDNQSTDNQFFTVGESCAIAKIMESFLKETKRDENLGA